MCKIYIDFDGVLVDTPRYIKEEIKNKGNCDDTFVNIEWDALLLICNEIYNNIEYLKKIYSDNDITILTHVYSQREKIEKSKFIREHIGNIDVITVPYNISKSEYVNPRNSLLIDDYNVNIESWKENGGIGYLIKNYEKLEDILPIYLEEDCI